MCLPNLLRSHLLLLLLVDDHSSFTLGWQAAKQMKKKKFMLPRTKSWAVVHQFLRKTLKMGKQEALFTYISQAFCPCPGTRTPCLPSAPPPAHSVGYTWSLHSARNWANASETRSTATHSPATMLAPQRIHG